MSGMHSQCTSIAPTKHSQLREAGIKSAGRILRGHGTGSCELLCYASQASETYAASCLAIHSEAGMVLGLPLIAPKPASKLITGHNYQICYCSLCAVHVLAQGCGHLNGDACLQSRVPANVISCSDNLHKCSHAQAPVLGRCSSRLVLHRGLPKWNVLLGDRRSATTQIADQCMQSQ